MPYIVSYIIGGVFALAATVLALIFICPEKKREKLPKFFRFVADVFNFKDLLLEKILRVLYIFSTMSCICVGFFMLFTGYSYGGWYYDTVRFVWTGWQGLIVMIGGPIAVRLVYEVLMMFILLVKNTNEINKKIKAPAEEAPKAPEQPEEVYIPNYRFCPKCGTKYDANKESCPNGCLDE